MKRSLMSIPPMAPASRRSRRLALVWVPVLLLGGVACGNFETASQTPTSGATQSGSPPTASAPAAPAQPGIPTTPQPVQMSHAPGTAVQPNFWPQRAMTGFSADGRHFLNLESYRDHGAGVPHARLQVVDLTANQCVAQGCRVSEFREADAERPIEAAEQAVLQEIQALREGLQLVALQPGTQLPITARSRTDDGTEVLTVALPNTDKTLELRLRQRQVKSVLQGGTAEKDQAAMQLVIRYDGQEQTLDSLSNYRDWVLAYSVREVRLSADGQHVAVLITAERRDFEGTRGTTLVQGFEL